MGGYLSRFTSTRADCCLSLLLLCVGFVPLPQPQPYRASATRSVGLCSYELPVSRFFPPKGMGQRCACVCRPLFVEEKELG